MSSPTTDVDFDDVIDRAWAGFTTALTERLSGPRDDQAIDLSREHVARGSASDLRFRRLPTGMVCAIVAVPAGRRAAIAVPPGWSDADGGHLVRIVDHETISTLVGEAVDLARSLLALPHPSFLRDDASVRARAQSMADHPSAGLSRVVGRVVRDRLAGVVGIDVHDAVELTYPDATAHLQVWGPQRSAMLWTTIRGAVDPDAVDHARAVVAAWPGFDLVVDGSVVDVEFAVDLGADPRTAIGEAIDRWHAFMTDELPALTAALTAPSPPDEVAMPAALRVAVDRGRAGSLPDAAGVAYLCGTDRGAAVDSMEVCRTQSLQWLHRADTATASGDTEGADEALRSSASWDALYSVFAAAVRIMVGDAA
ncbi:hypothetical protein ASG12_12695 [Williamsia sp. Leaf354]|jgi:hypothetical protein|uniref:hypothetical protein n=1 Tax=Williamsia sp. Leaf354 TaxID=1736349 RepID=UPI000700D3C0|nr:hypothetical protein [Williamsia sp. Leaf354]KQR97886.1 hypothetical protein ASG12_12695 [Williamsia sp. Leaf354]